MSHGTNLPSISPRVRDIIVGVTSSVEVVPADFLTPILPKIIGELTREGLINIHRLVSGNVASVASNLIGGQHGHLALTMKSTEYMAQTGFGFFPTHNPDNYLPTILTAQEQALGPEKSQQNQELFRKCTAMDGANKKHIVTAVEPFFLSSLVDQLTGFVQVSALTMIQHLFTSYGEIDEINLEENVVKMMDPYDPAEPLALFIEQVERGREFARAGGQTISEVIMVSKGITPLAQTYMFNKYIR